MPIPCWSAYTQMIVFNPELPMKGTDAVTERKILFEMTFYSFCNMLSLRVVRVNYGFRSKMVSSHVARLTHDVRFVLLNDERIQGNFDAQSLRRSPTCFLEIDKRRTALSSKKVFIDLVVMFR